MDESLSRLIRDAMPLAAELGLEGIEGGPEAVVLRGAWAPERCTAAATIEAKTNFLTAVRSGFVTARAEPVHVGRRTIVVQVDVTDDAGTRVTRTLQTQAVIAADGG